MNSIIESFGSTEATLGGGFFVGILISYALKKVIKIVVVILALYNCSDVNTATKRIINIITVCSFLLKSILESNF